MARDENRQQVSWEIYSLIVDMLNIVRKKADAPMLVKRKTVPKRPLTNEKEITT